MADSRFYFRVDVGYFTNPKIAAVLAESPAAITLHLESIAYAAQHLTDGIVPRALVMRMVGAKDSDAQLLIDAGLWIADGTAATIEVHDYLEHQRSAAEANRASLKGKRAAASRWESSEDAQGNASSTATSNASGNATSNAQPNAQPNATRARDEMRGEERRGQKNTSSPAGAVDGDFEEFWGNYPRKRGRGQAVRAWKAATKKAPPDVIMAGLLNHLPGWSGTEEKFIPHASTWLNGERWDDLPPAPPAADVVDTRPEGWR